jgi:hypothetical protein
MLSMSTNPSHLSAMEGASEEHPQAYLGYGEAVPEYGNAAARQELPVQLASPVGRAAVRRVG